MKVLTKIAIVTSFIALVSSCQKEQLPTPGGCSSHQQDSAKNLRVTDAPETDTQSNSPVIKDEKNSYPDEIVGGGDDDRDGGGSGRKGGNKPR